MRALDKAQTLLPRGLDCCRYVFEHCIGVCVRDEDLGSWCVTAACSTADLSRLVFAGTVGSINSSRGTRWLCQRSAVVHSAILHALGQHALMNVRTLTVGVENEN